MRHHPRRAVPLEGRRLQWRELEDVPPSRFGFAVAVHPRDPDTAWFVPADKDERR